MKQIINWLRYYWAKWTRLRSTNDINNQLVKNQSDNLFEEGTERPMNKVYYSIPGRGTFWAYIDKGRIIKTVTKRPY